MSTRELTAGGDLSREAIAYGREWERIPGIGALGRRSGGGLTAVLLAGLAVYAHRRTGAATVTVGHRAAVRSTEITLTIGERDDFRTLTARAGALLRRAATGAQTPRADEGNPPDIVLHGDGHPEVPGPQVPVVFDLVARLVADPRTPLARIDLVGPADRARILRRRGPAAADDPRATALSGFRAVARRRPDAVALRWDDRTLTYGALADRVRRVARALRARGVTPETVVAVAIGRSVESIVAIYAVLDAGGAYLPLDPAHPAPRHERVLTVARPAFVITTRRDEFSTRATTVRYLEDLESQAGPAAGDAHAAQPGNLAYLLFTSGSTGVPKGVAVTHAALAGHLSWMTERIGLGPTDVVLYKTNPIFDASLWELFWPLSIGATLAIAPPSADTDPAELDRAMRAHAVTTVQFVPSTLTTHLGVLTGFPDTVRRVLTIGETLTPALARRFRAAASARLHNLYGPTEATGAVTEHLLTASDETVIPIGDLATDTRAYVLDARLRPVPDGLPGELYLAGRQLARGYRDDPARTADRFVADPFEPGARMYRTGDVVSWNAGTELLEYHGRTDFQVKRHGVRIELGEVEAALSEDPVVAAAVATCDQDGRLLGYVVPVPGAAGVAETVRARLVRTVPPALVPDDIVVVSAFPATATGKVDRAALPRPVSAALPYRAPRTPEEKVLADVFAQVLGREQVGIDDSFFALGGDSVMSILLVSRAKARGVSLTPAQVFELPTVAELATVATRSAAPEMVAELPGAGVGEMPLPPAVAALVAHAEATGAAFDDYVQYMVLDLPVGITEATVLGVIGAVAGHHDMLRARLYRDAGGRWRLFADPAGSFDVAASTTRLVVDGGNDETPPVPGNTVVDDAVAAAVARIDPAAGHVLHCVWLDRGPSRAGQLVVAIHHIAVDGVSWRVLVPDFVAAWSRLEAGGIPRLPAIGTSVRRWSHLLRERADRISAAEREHWLAVATAPDPLFTARALDPRVDTAATVRRAVVESDAATTTAVIETLPARYGTTANTVLLTALALTVLAWRADGASALTVRLEGHGRESDLFAGADLARTVGWFTATHPCRLDLAGHDIAAALTGGPALSRVLKTTKEQLLSIPRGGVGYGLLRTTDPDALPEATAQLSFTYLGSLTNPVGGPWLPSAVESRAHATGLPPEVGIAVDAVVRGGRLVTGFAHPNTLIDATRMRAMTDRFRAVLELLTRHAADPAAGGRTPSDFTSADVSQDEIEEWERRYGRLDDIRPLTPMQQRFAETAPADPTAADVNTMQVVLTFTGTPDRARLRAAAERTVARHAALRGAFVRDRAGGWRQLVVATAPIDITERDLRGQDADLTDLLTAELVRPFDFAAPPLMRFLLLRVGDDEWKLVVTNHRGLYDGWSAPILMRELMAGFAFGVDPDEKFEVDDGFAEFLRGRAALDREAAARAWRAALQDPPPPTLLAAPGAASADPVRTNHEVRWSLAQAQSAALARLAAAEGVTVNTVLQYLWGSVLSDLTGHDDVLFFTAVSGRPADLPGIAEMVGAFVGGVPVRVRGHVGTPVGEALRALQAEQTALIDHQHFSAAEIHAATGIALRDMLDTLFMFESYPTDVVPTPLALGELVLTDIDSTEINPMPLTVTIWPRERLTVSINRHHDLIDEQTFERVVDRFRHRLDLLTREAGR